MVGNENIEAVSDVTKAKLNRVGENMYAERTDDGVRVGYGVNLHEHQSLDGAVFEALVDAIEAGADSVAVGDIALVRDGKLDSHKVFTFKSPDDDGYPMARHGIRVRDARDLVDAVRANEY